MHEDGAVFLPCCYGYATTIRRAQGTSLHMVCIYFNQHKHPAARGYGYVAVSRFRSRRGCFLYGKLRRTDFLPVGEEKEEEVTERGYLSVSDNNEDDTGMEHAFQGGGRAFDDTESDEGMGDARGEAASGLENAFQDGIRGVFEGSDVDENPDADCQDFFLGAKMKLSTFASLVSLVSRQLCHHEMKTVVHKVNIFC